MHRRSTTETAMNPIGQAFPVINMHLVVTPITPIMDVAAELGNNLVSKHQIQPECVDEQADAGRDCRTRLARLNSQARTRTGKYSFFMFS